MCHDVRVLFACFVAMQKTCVFFELLAIGAFESVHRGYLKCGKKERRYASVECVGASDLSVGVSANLFEIRDGT